MTDYKSYTKSITGIEHKNKGMPLQDASYPKKETVDAPIHILIVADGHGDSSCLRSDVGAQMAVEYARECINTFVDEHEHLFHPKDFRNHLSKVSNSKHANPEESVNMFMKTKKIPTQNEFRKILREELLEKIVQGWIEKVTADWEENPFTSEELSKLNDKWRERYKIRENIKKAYGTTLMGVAITEFYWFAFHVGDGRLCALKHDGDFGQPVVWDDKCFLNVVTSLCDDDILKREQGVRFRLTYSFLKPPPVAFFLCSDGIDDNFPILDNEKYLYNLYKDVALNYHHHGVKNTKEKLDKLVKRFANEGKGDDTTLAILIDLEGLKNVIKIWEEADARNQNIDASNQTHTDTTPQTAEKELPAEPDVISKEGERRLPEVVTFSIKKQTLVVSSIFFFMFVFCLLILFKTQQPEVVDASLRQIPEDIQSTQAQRSRQRTRQKPPPPLSLFVIEANNHVYDGNEKEAKITKRMTSACGCEMDNLEVFYAQEGKSTTPKEIGSYQIYINFPGCEHFRESSELNVGTMNIRPENND